MKGVEIKLYFAIKDMHLKCKSQYKSIQSGFCYGRLLLWQKYEENMMKL